VPLGDDWLLSGPQRPLPPGRRSRTLALELAAGLAQHDPRLLFRHPELLEKAWQQERAHHEVFVERFGGPEALLTGDRLQEAMDGLLAAQQEAAATASGKTPWQIAAEKGRPLTTSFPLPDALLEAEDVGVLSDPTWGLGLYLRYGELRAVFADPARLEDPEARHLVLGYLHSPQIDPLPFLQLARAFPDGASAVLARVLDRPGFDWARDGEELLRERKAAAYPPLPSVSPLREELVEALRRLEERQASTASTGG